MGVEFEYILVIIPCLSGNVAVKFNFLCSAYFWIPCTVQITKNIFLDFSSFTGVINARAKLRNELFILLRFYYVIIHIRRGLRKVCAVRTRDFNDVGGSGISVVAALKA